MNISLLAVVCQRCWERYRAMRTRHCQHCQRMWWLALLIVVLVLLPNSSNPGIVFCFVFVFVSINSLIYWFIVIDLVCRVIDRFPASHHATARNITVTSAVLSRFEIVIFLFQQTKKKCVTKNIYIRTGS